MKRVAVIALVILALSTTGLAAQPPWNPTPSLSFSFPQPKSWVYCEPGSGGVIQHYDWLAELHDMAARLDDHYAMYSALAQLIKPGMTVRQIRLILPPSSPWAEWGHAFYGSISLTSPFRITGDAMPLDSPVKTWFRYSLDDCYSVYEEELGPSGSAFIPGRIVGPPQIVFSEHYVNLGTIFWGTPFQFGSPFPLYLAEESGRPRLALSLAWPADPSHRPATLSMMVSLDDFASETPVARPIPIDDMDLCLPSRDSALLAEAQRIRDWFALLDTKRPFPTWITLYWKTTSRPPDFMSYGDALSSPGYFDYCFIPRDLMKNVFKGELPKMPVFDLARPADPLRRPATMPLWLELDFPYGHGIRSN
jgi:hypothetical protein